MLADFLTPGALAGWVTAAVVIYGLVIFRKGGGGAALGELETANRVLDKRNRELLAQAVSDREQIAGLRTSRDFAQALAPIMQTVAEHEREHRETLSAILAALESIAVRLDPQKVPDGRDLPAEPA